MTNTNEFGIRTDEQHLRALHRDLAHAREIVCDLDEGNTIDGRFIGGLEKGRDERITTILNCLDEAIFSAAMLLDELDT
jgi:hypothetical protein